MSFTSFFKNLLGSNEDTAVEPTDPNAPKNLTQRGPEFRRELAATPNAVLLDVRTPGEFAAGSLPEARNIDFLGRDFSTQVAKLDKNATYFIFCRSGQRSANACRQMHKMGYNVRNLAGGIGAF